MTTDLTALARTRGHGIEEALESACERLRRDGVPPEGYIQELAWLLYLKAFDEVEARLEREASARNAVYVRRLAGEYCWSVWATAVKDASALSAFVLAKLWPYLQTFGTGERGCSGDAAAERFRHIFSMLRVPPSAETLAHLVQQVDGIEVTRELDAPVLARVYARLLRASALESAGRSSGHDTPPHIVRAMLEVTKPRPGERIYDPCCGSAGLLVAAAECMKRDAGAMRVAGTEAGSDRQRLSGVELNPHAYLLGLLNVMFHRVEGAQLQSSDPLAQDPEGGVGAELHDVVLSNPWYVCKPARNHQELVALRSGTREVLFLQHVMSRLSEGGRAGIVVPEGLLFRGGAAAKLRARLLSDFDVHTVLSLPAGCFLPGSGAKTNVLFFDRRRDGRGTESVWFYEMQNDGYELKSTRRPVPGGQWADFHEKRLERAESAASWNVSIDDLRKQACELSACHPRRQWGAEQRSSSELLEAIHGKEIRVLQLVEELRHLLGEKIP